MSTPAASAPADPSVTVIEDSTCTFCGCVCDDIDITVKDDHITDAKRACVLGKAWFYNHHADDRPSCLIEGRPASVEEGVERAARILTEAKYPIVYGLSDTTSEAQRVAVSIADAIAGTVDTTTSVCHGPSGMAFQDVGEVTCTLGEIANRGDLIIFWGGNPAESHPRHFTKYSLMPKGMFVPNGRKDRTVVLVDVRKSKSVPAADIFVQIKPRKDFEALWALRALAREQTVAGAPEPDAALAALAARLRGCRHGAILHHVRGELEALALYALVRDLAAVSHVVSVTLRREGNGAGAGDVLAWQTGYPSAVSFATGYPRASPGELSGAAVLARGDADAALVVGSDPLEHLPPEAAERLRAIPVVSIDARDTATAAAARVAFTTAAAGVHRAGVVHRLDGVPVPLHAPLHSSRPSDEEVLAAIAERMAQMGEARA